MHFKKKKSFSLSISSVNVAKSAGTVDLVTFTKENLNGKFNFLFSDVYVQFDWKQQ